jgi:hypothetical protein
LGKAIGTSNYRTVQEILAETASEVIKPDISDDSSGKWSLTRLPNGNYGLEVFGIGVGNIRGYAEIIFDSGSNDIVFLEGDASVVPAVYRDNYAEEIIRSVAV